MPSQKRPSKKLYGLRAAWTDLSKMRKWIISLGGVAAAVIAISGALAVTTKLVEEKRFWAKRVTEIVVAGWQEDRLGNIIRDIEGRIIRLQTEKKLYPAKWSGDKQAELNYWIREQTKKDRVLKEIQQQKGPVVEK